MILTQTGGGVGGRLRPLGAVICVGNSEKRSRVIRFHIICSAFCHFRQCAVYSGVSLGLIRASKQVTALQMFLFRRKHQIIKPSWRVAHAAFWKMSFLCLCRSRLVECSLPSATFLCNEDVNIWNKTGNVQTGCFYIQIWETLYEYVMQAAGFTAFSNSCHFPATSVMSS